MCWYASPGIRRPGTANRSVYCCSITSLREEKYRTCCCRDEKGSDNRGIFRPAVSRKAKEFAIFAANQASSVAQAQTLNQTADSRLKGFLGIGYGDCHRCLSRFYFQDTDIRFLVHMDVSYGK